MNRLGYPLFLIGIIGASVYAAPKPPHWLPFALFLLAGAAGGLMVRLAPGRAAKRAKKKDPGASLSAAAVAAELAAIEPRLRKAAAEAAGVGAVKSAAEKTLAALLPLIEGRTGVQTDAGMQAYADIFSEISLVERHLNRAWSAAVDGHAPEAQASLKKAAELLPAAGKTARKYA